MDVILTYELSKQYGGQSALRNLNLKVPEGGTLACIGGKNAGKTTLLRLLSGLCRPTCGECSVLGLSPFFEVEKLHSLVGTALESARLYKDMTLSENLLFFAGINGVSENDAIERISFLLHTLDIWEARDEKINELPTGVVRRASLARALIHSPRLLLLDAPAAGFDRETSESTHALLSRLVSEEGMTLLLCTRDTAYASLLCDHFAVMEEGELLARGDYETLRKGAGLRRRAALRLGENDLPPQGFQQTTDGLWQREIKTEEEMARIISQVVASGSRLYEAKVIQPTLEEIYTAILKGGIRRAGESDEQDDEYEYEAEAEAPGRGELDSPETDDGTEPAVPETGEPEWPEDQSVENSSF